MYPTVVRITGIWRHLPPANLSVPAAPANLVAIQPALYFGRNAGATSVKSCSLVNSDPYQRRLLENLGTGQKRLALSNCAHIHAGVWLMVNTLESSRIEFVRVHSVSGTPNSTRPGIIQLAYAVQNRHTANTRVCIVDFAPHDMPPPPPGNFLNLAEDALAGDGTIFLKDTALFPGKEADQYLLLSDGQQPSEVHRYERYEVSTNQQGYYRLPQLGRLAQVEIEAHNKVYKSVKAVLNPDYLRAENQLDFIFRG